MTQPNYQQRSTTTAGRPNAQRAQQFAPKARDGEIEVAKGGSVKQGEYVARMAMSQAQRRDLEAVKAAVEMEAALTADDFFYSWTVKSKDGPKLVEGISIDGALILLSNWGNCICKPELLEDEAPTHWLFKVTFIDLERGFQMERLFRQRKSESHQRSDGERLQDIAFQIGQSKAIRNLVLNSLPAWLQDAALAAAKKAAEKSFGDVPVEFAKFVTALAKHGVTKEMILAKLGKVESDVVASDLVNLRGIGRAVRDGQTTIAREFWGELGNDDNDGPDPEAQQPTQTQAATPTATAAEKPAEKPQETPAAQTAASPPPAAQAAEKAPVKQDTKKGPAPREPGDDLPSPRPIGKRNGPDGIAAVWAIRIWEAYMASERTTMTAEERAEGLVRMVSNKRGVAGEIAGVKFSPSGPGDEERVSEIVDVVRDAVAYQIASAENEAERDVVDLVRGLTEYAAMLDDMGKDDPAYVVLMMRARAWLRERE